MSAITIGDDLIHYQVLGRGRPVILVHGWIGSWRYWIPTMQHLRNEYRVYALDLYGYGDSSKNNKKYSLQSQIDLIDNFLNKLGIAKTAFIGHSMGAMVVARFAANPKNHGRVARVMVSNIPLFDPGDLETRDRDAHRFLTDNRTSQEVQPVRPSIAPTDATIPTRTAAGLMRAAADNLTHEQSPTIANRPDEMLFNDVVLSGHNPLKERFKNSSLLDLLGRCFRKSEADYDKLKVDVDKADNNVLQSSIRDFDSGAMLDTLRHLPMPTVIVHGANDPLLSPPPENVLEYLTEGRGDDRVLPVVLPDTRHFPMLEQEVFLRLSHDFLKTPDISTIEVKGRWSRRIR
ncbi:MAG: alpha/beta hydrolase [Chloroflexi bacterium]|nr:MAG: hypothetical protein CUN54_05235 [Phototrophicales bacterium]RMF79761.1 MAG: alpha/beta hydrolase [Chloroflexota bacterium]